MNRFFWLGREDSNLRMAAPKAAALPLGDSPVFNLRGLDWIHRVND